MQIFKKKSIKNDTKNDYLKNTCCFDDYCEKAIKTLEDDEKIAYTKQIWMDAKEFAKQDNELCTKCTYQKDGKCNAGFFLDENNKLDRNKYVQTSPGSLSIKKL